MAKLAFNRIIQELDGDAAPYAGAKLFTYEAGSSTKETTYQDAAGSTAHANPIILDANGRVPAGVYLTEGQSYKFVLAPSDDTDPPASPIWTLDDIEGINDANVTISEWQASNLSPTYVSATSFTFTGDQTSVFHVGRRLKIVDAGGTKYATIRTSAFGVLTTLTIDLDAGGSLSSPLSSVAYGILAATNSSIPAGFISPTQISGNQNNYAPPGYGSAKTLRVSSDATRNVTGLAGGTDGREVTVHNVGTFAIVFPYEDTNSSAANRFAFACTLGGGQSMQIIYDGTSARWRAVQLPEPLGTIKDFMGTLPSAFLAVDQNVSRTTYASLFNYPGVGTTWGSGDGSTTFGLFVGAGHALIAAGTGTQVDSGVDGDVDLGNDTLTVPSNADKWVTGKLVTFTLASGTITGLTSGNPYYVIRASATTIKLASSHSNAVLGTAIDLTAKSSPVWTITHTLTARTLGQRGGSENTAITTAGLPASGLSIPSLSVSASATTHSIAGSPAASTFGTGTDAGSFSSASVSGSTGTGTTGNMGSGGATNDQNPYAVTTRGVRYV